MMFELNFENSLDKFKDLKQGEHQKIIRFVEDKKKIFANFTSDINCIGKLYTLYLEEHSSNLNPLQLKASISAGYFLMLLQK